MSNEFIENNAAALKNIGNLALSPAMFDEETSLTNYTKLSISIIPDMGTAFDPIASQCRKLLAALVQLLACIKSPYPVALLAEFKSGVGSLGTALDANNQILG